jgi:hypothetical protein
MDKLDTITHGMLSWMVSAWFQDLKKDEHLIVKEFREMRGAKKDAAYKS